MDYELQCWGQENLKEYWQQDPNRTWPETHLPWVVISKRGNREIIEFSSKNRSEAMAFMLEHLVQENYSKWKDEVIETFGLSTEVIHEILLRYILTPKERELLSDYYDGGLKLKRGGTRMTSEARQGASAPQQKALLGLEGVAPASPGWRAKVTLGKTSKFPSISRDAQEKIRHLYLEERLSSLEIAKKLGIRLRLVTSAIARMGIARSFKEAASITKERGYSPACGEASHAWKGGRYKLQGYVHVYVPEHPRVKDSRNPSRRYVAEHIIVWEQVHQRLLPKNWVVHHINGIKADNRPENLVAYPKKRHDHLIPEMAHRIRALEIETQQLRKALEDSQLIMYLNEN